MSFSVTIDGTNAPITERERLCLDCTVENTGSEAAERTVEAGVGTLAEGKDRTKLALDAGESDNTGFELGETYRIGEAVQYDRTVWVRPVDSPETGDEVTVPVSKPPYFAVQIQSTNAPVAAGEKIEVTATVENTGGQTGHETVALAAKEWVNTISNEGSITPGGGDLDAFIDTTTKAVARGTGGDVYQIGKHERMDAVGVALDPGKSEEVTLEWDTGPSTAAVEPGDYALGVGTLTAAKEKPQRGKTVAVACTDGSSNDAVVVTVQNGPMRTGRFVVEIDGVAVPGWRFVAIPSRFTEEEESQEGDSGGSGQSAIAHPEMARAVEPDDTTLYDWAEAVRQGDVEEGRKEISIVLLDENGETQAEWELQKAWIATYDPPELDASADGDVATEQITVAFDKMERKEQ